MIGYRIRVRRGLESEWVSDNPILGSGEFGYVTDIKELKIGDGTTPWNELPYIHANFARFVLSETQPENPPVGTIWIPAP